MSEKTFHNNFDFLRLLFASLVIVSHSFVLVGMPDCDWLCQFLQVEVSVAGIAVKGFFVISGFLVLTSAKNSKRIGGYYWKRFIRIYPGLFVALIITVLSMQFISSTGILEYWTNITTFSYIPRNLFLVNLQYPIDGVFENNPYPNAINGSLWTIPYEVACYILLSSIVLIRSETLTNRIIWVFFILSYSLTFYLKSFIGHHAMGLSMYFLVDLATYFFAGSVLSIIRPARIAHQWKLTLFALLLFLLAVKFELDSLKYISFPVAVIFFGSSSLPVLSRIREQFGDISYGMYIYAFPIQQLVVYAIEPNHVELMVISTILTIPVAYVSWKYVEQPILKWKNLF